MSPLLLFKHKVLLNIFDLQYCSVGRGAHKWLLRSSLEGINEVA